jgi:hypothetical protein
MTPTTILPKWIALSERIYSALLVLYPTDYRREYGTLMVQVFRDVCRDQYHRQGLPGMVLWWCATFLDLAFTVIEQRRKVRFTLSKSSFLQFTGALLVLAGVCSALAAISQLQPGSHYTFHGVYQLSMFMILPAFGFTAFGIWGLALRRQHYALGSPFAICGWRRGTRRGHWLYDHPV